MTDLTRIIEEAQDAAPSAEELAEIQAAAEAARVDYETKLDALKRAAVGRARVFGWVRVGKETDLSPKQLHSWARHIPGTDLSKLADLKEEADG